MGRGALTLKRPVLALAATCTGVLLADRVTKYLVQSRMRLHESIPIIGRVLRLTYVRNTGAAFGLFPGRAAVFMTVSILVVAGVSTYWWRYRPTHPVVVIATSLLAAGSLGNLFDRATVGRVTDFIEVPYWPVFNVADSAIVVGVAMLVWWLLFGPAEHNVAAGRTAAVDAPDGPDEPSGG